MRRPLLALLACTALAVTGCSADDQLLADDLTAALQEDEGAAAAADEGSDVPSDPVDVSTDLVDAEGSVLGTATFREEESRAVVEVQVAGLTGGFHPMYLSSGGGCDLDDPTAVLLELPALLVLENGVGSMSTLAGTMSLDALAEDDGTALLVGPPVQTLGDIRSVLGNEVGPFATGSQVACGVIGG